MVERIIVNDPKLKAREEAAIADLRALAPDGVIDGLDSKDKSLGKRLSKLYPRLGYETRKDMIEAFGFTLASKGGRPRGVDPAQYLEKLMELYPEGTSCASLTDFRVLLGKEHPELVSSLKTVINGSQAAFGCTFLDVLRQRGLVGERLGYDVEACETALDMLKERSADAGDLPVSLGELFERNPEIQVSRRELSSYIKDICGATPAAYLTQLGILQSAEQKSKTANDDLSARLDEAVADIARRQADLMLNERPKSLKAIMEAFPEYADLLKQAQIKKLLTQEDAVNRNLIKPIGAFKKPRFKRCILDSVRNAGTEELLKVWEASGLPACIDRNSEHARLLPSSIARIDLNARIQEEEVLFSKCLKSSQSSQDALEEYLQRLEEIADNVKCELVTNQESEGYVLWQVRVIETKPLSAKTLAYGLRKAEKLTAGDFGLSDSWRIRYADVLESA